MNVLITGAGAAGAVSIIQALREGLPGIFVVGVDADAFAAGKNFADRFYVVPLARDPLYTEEMLKLCNQEQIRVALISVDEEIEVLVQERHRFSAIGTQLALAEPENVLSCLDKFAFYNRMRVKGIALPETWLFRDFDFTAFSGKGYVIKPRFGRGSQDIHFTEALQDLVYLKSTLPKGFIIQERIRGREYTVDVLRNRQGKFLAVVPRLRIATESGLSIKGMTVHHEDLMRDSPYVMECLDLWGACNIQWIIDDAGTPWLIEVNPRLAGSVILSVKAGANIPVELVKILADAQYDGQPMAFREGTLMLRYWQAVFEEGKASHD
ncbi:MAG: ATP-grasp domain-containing protein [Bacillota bacterium]